MKSKIKQIVSIFLAFLLCCSLNNSLFKEVTMAIENNEISPQIIETNYISDDIIVADIVITEQPYLADKTGKADCSKILKEAIDKLNTLGGGTIYFPHGIYRITQSITINNYITLVGDYNDPDTANGDYGTVIIADVKSTIEDLPALFRFRGSSGVIGFTIYYPGQIATDIRPFPYTFEIMGGAYSILEHMQFTIKNVTLLNSYKGVAASRTINPNVAVGSQDAHEGLIIENLKGTVLKVGINAVNESDIGYYKNIVFSAKYWAQAEAYDNPTEDQITAFTSLNGVGLMLGDLEWSPYYDITVDGFLTGVHIIEGTRLQEEFPITFMGGFYNLNIINCSYALVADSLYWGWGMLVTNSRLEGRILAIENNSQVGYIRLTNVETSGEYAGDRIYVNTAQAPNISVTTPNLYKTKNKLYDVVEDYGVVADGYTECGDKIQSAVNAAGANGGGVVYLRAGFYKVSVNLNVPENVLLRGACSVTNRDNLNKSNGTVIFSYCDEATASPQTDTAFITLNKNSGLSGLRIVYPENNLKFVAKDVYGITPTAFTVRAIGDGAYVTNVGLPDSYNGIEFLNANNGLIKGVPALFFNVGISVNNSDNVTVENVFSNATVATQSGYNTAFSDLFSNGWLWRITSIWNYYNYTETHTQIVSINDSTNVKLVSLFTFCSAGIVNGIDSDFTMIGCGADRMWSEGIVANLTNSKMTMINQLKYRCMTYETSGDSKINIYGRMNLMLDSSVTAYNDTEQNVNSNVMIKDGILAPTMNKIIIDYPKDIEWKESVSQRNPLKDILMCF